MNGLFVMKGQLQNIYAKYSKFIDKGVQLLIALVTFFMINSNLGYISILANPIISVGLAVICAFLPPVIMAIVAAGLILAHLYAVSLGLLIVVAIIFLLMFIFYVRFTPKMAMVIVLTGLAFMLKIPYVIPVACGLLAAPISAVPVSCGAITYYMIAYAKEVASTLKNAEDSSFIDDISVCAKSIFQNKEMWVTVLAMIICVLVVYNVRRLSIAHSWKVAIVAGAAVCVVFTVAGDMAFDVSVSYVPLIVGNVVAIVVGLVLELVFFCVDYTRTETLQYEDDDYYYYVKAIPKINVAAPDKTVKTITDSEEDDEERNNETQIIDNEENRRKAVKSAKKRRPENAKRVEKSDRAERPVRAEKSDRAVKKVRVEDGAVKRKRPPKAKSSNVPSNTEHLLLTQSLEKELKLNQKR